MAIVSHRPRSVKVKLNIFDQAVYIFDVYPVDSSPDIEREAKFFKPSEKTLSKSERPCASAAGAIGRDS